jgi:hypothetical protein
LCHVHDGGEDPFTVSGAGTISAIYTFDAGLWLGTTNGEIRRFDGTLERVDATGDDEVMELHGTDPDNFYAALRTHGVWQRNADAGWSRAFPDDMKVYTAVHVISPSDVWAINISNPPTVKHKTGAVWSTLDPAFDLGINTDGGRLYVLGIRGTATELLVAGSIENFGPPQRYDGIVVRMLRGP